MDHVVLDADKLKLEWTPMKSRVFVARVVSDEMTEGGIVLPESGRAKHLMGYVVAVGEGTVRKGQRLPVDVAFGDFVMFRNYAGKPIAVEDPETVAYLTANGLETKLLLLEEDDLLLKITDPQTADVTATAQRRWTSKGGGDETPATYHLE